MSGKYRTKDIVHERTVFLEMGFAGQRKSSIIKDGIVVKYVT